MTATTASYNGDSAFCGFMGSLRGSSKPSAFTLFGQPKVLPRTGDIVITGDPGGTITFPDCVLANVSEIGSVTAYHFHDRRALLEGSSYDGVWNVPIAGGATFQHELAPQTLATRLLDKIGESGYDVSELPNDPRPFIDGRGKQPREVLDYLCWLLGCRLVLGLDNNFAIRAIGSGTAASTTNQILNPLDYTTGTYPANVVVEYAPSQYQCWLKLALVEPDGSGGFTTATYSEVPWIKDEYAFRFYRISATHPTSLTPPTYGTTISDIEDVLPLLERGAEIITTPDTSGLYRPQIHGKWHTGQYCGVNHASITTYPFPFKLYHDIGVVEFDRPVFKCGTSGNSEACDELYLEAAFNLRETGDDGELIRNAQSQSQSGDIARDEHRLRQPLYIRNVAGYNASGTFTAWTDNSTAVNALADHLIDAHEPSVQQRTMRPKRNAGIISAEPGGIVQQVTWAFGLPTLDYGGAPMTWIGGDCNPFDFDGGL